MARELVWETGFTDGEPNGNEPHMYTVVNHALMIARKEANDNMVDDNGNRMNIKTSEHGRGLYRQGNGWAWIHLTPVLVSENETECLVRGQHEESAKRYATLTEARELALLWNPPKEGI